MKTKSILVIAFTFVLLQSRAQKIDDLKQKYPGDEAVVLNASEDYRISIVSGKPYIESVENQQILFLSSSAAAYLSHYSFSHSDFHQLKSYNAFTQTADKKKIKVSNFKTYNSQSSSVFYDDVKETSFDFPGISAGAVGNLEVSQVHSNPYLLYPHYFKRSIPVIKSRLVITFPNTLSLKYLIRGNDSSLIKFSQVTRRGETTYTFEGNELAGEKSYEDAPGTAYYSTHVVFYIEKYINEKGETVNYLESLKDLYALNYSFVKDINKEAGPELRSIVDSLTRNATTLEQKARNIYRWVQQNIKYVAFEDGMEGFVPREANAICIKRYGDCKDMSSILTLMMNTAGVPAYYTWIGTRSLPYKYTDLPTPIVDNHMISAIQIEKDRFIFLDGTDANCIFGVPPQAIQDKQALIAISPDQYKVITVPIIPKEQNVMTDSTFLELTDNGIIGNIRLDLSGYFSMYAHSALQHTTEREMEKYIKDILMRGSNKFRLEGYDLGDFSNPSAISVRARFRLEDYARKLGDEWYLNLNLFKLYEHQEIDYPKRKMPVVSDFRFIKKFVTVLTIPEGYRIDYVPPGKKYQNDVWGFTINYEQKDNRLIFTQEFDNDHIMLYPDQFQAWNEVLKNVLPLYKESVTLSKK